MKRWVYWCAFLLCRGTALAGDTPAALDKLLKSVESRYNHAQSLTLDFSETYAGIRRPLARDAGVLYLRKPGRMRWDYSTPAGKVFISDGKDVFLYTPDDHRAERSRLKQSGDMRAPMAFLLGKLDFAKEFKSFQMRPEGELTWIVAQPKSDSLAYTKVEFLTDAAGAIHRVRVTGQDLSTLDFAFTNERDNVPVPESLFRFAPPPGVQVVETGQ